LDAVDRWHLHGLAAVARGTELLTEEGVDEPSIRDSTVRILTRLDPVPACVMDHRGDLLTWNRSFRAFALSLRLLAGSPPNLIRWVFEDERARTVLADWERMADTVAAWLYTLGNGDPRVEELAEELAQTAGPAFSGRWQSHPVQSPSHAPRTWLHPEAGPVTLHLEAFTISGTDRLHLLVLEPVDDTTEATLSTLSSAATSPSELGDPSAAGCRDR
jgi:hypothetical protein